jgi:hypothetical protein
LIDLAKESFAHFRFHIVLINPKLIMLPEVDSLFRDYFSCHESESIIKAFRAIEMISKPIHKETFNSQE